MRITDPQRIDTHIVHAAPTELGVLWVATNYKHGAPSGAFSVSACLERLIAVANCIFT